MDKEKQLVQATLAAAIVVARQAVKVVDIQTAWKDAENIISPRPRDQNYKDWQTANDLVPTTPEEDQARQKAYADGVAEVARKLSRK